MLLSRLSIILLEIVLFLSIVTVLMFYNMPLVKFIIMRCCRVKHISVKDPLISMYCNIMEDLQKASREF